MEMNVYSIYDYIILGGLTRRRAEGQKKGKKINKEGRKRKIYIKP